MASNKKPTARQLTDPAVEGLRNEPKVKRVVESIDESPLPSTDPEEIEHLEDEEIVKPVEVKPVEKYFFVLLESATYVVRGVVFRRGIPTLITDLKLIEELSANGRFERVKGA